MRKDWVISVQQQCLRDGVPFFFKRWGGIHKSKAGRLLEGRIYDEMPRAEELVSIAPISAAV
jgi:protein gp37